MLTLKQVSRAISEALGGDYELVKGNGYFYIWGGDAPDWMTSTIPVYTLNQLTLDQWIEAAKGLKAENEYRGSDQEAQDLRDKYGPKNGRRTAAHEPPEPCQYGPDVYGTLSSECEKIGEIEIPISDIVGSALKKEWPSVDEDVVQKLLQKWVNGEYDEAKPLEVMLVNGEYWLWDGHSRYVMLQRMNPGGTVVVNVVERFPESGDTMSAAASYSPSATASRNCTRCQPIGSGKCAQCGGRGTGIIPTRTCTSCGGTGQCRFCGGTGQEQSDPTTAARSGDTEKVIVDGDPVDIDSLNGWKQYEKTAPTRMVQMDQPFSVETLEGTMTADAGDFLAVGPEGEMYPIEEEIQRQTYREVEDAPTGMHAWRNGSPDDSEFPDALVPMISEDLPTDRRRARHASIDPGEAQVGDRVIVTGDPFSQNPEQTSEHYGEEATVQEISDDGTWSRYTIRYDDGIEHTLSGSYLSKAGRRGRTAGISGVTSHDGTTWIDLDTGEQIVVEGDDANFWFVPAGQPTGEPDPMAEQQVMEEPAQEQPSMAMRRTASGRRRFGATYADAANALDEVRGSILPEHVAKYENMLRLECDPDLVLATLDRDLPLLLRL